MTQEDESVARPSDVIGSALISVHSEAGRMSPMQQVTTDHLNMPTCPDMPEERCPEASETEVSQSAPESHKTENDQLDSGNRESSIPKNGKTETPAVVN